jgi:hypothetical protein
MGRRRYSAAILCCNINLVAMAICNWNYSYCNIYGTGYQLRYVYHNNDSGIMVEYITCTLNFYKFRCYTYDPPFSSLDHHSKSFMTIL